MALKRIQTVALIALAIGCTCARANPDSPTVVHGSATFSQPNANTLNVNTSTNKAIINWKGFNIGAGQTTNFIQPNRNSAVLNRVTGSDPSKIYGNLNSNGKVFLINQHGMMIGPGARINTAGFYGSTLNITNEDFLKGNLKFEGGGFGGIVNKGYIHAGLGGNVVLIAPDIENGGVIEVEDGKVLLAAGKSIRITSLNDSAIEFDVTSNGDNSIINLGDIIAKQGAVRLFADSLTHSGAISANGLVQNADGTISLVARQDIRIAAGATLNADGDSGGSISVQSHHGDVIFEGSASAQGRTHRGGRIEILGNRVGLFGDALVDASGVTGGGTVLVGGDFQGRGDTQTARQTQVGPHAVIRADAIDSGDGGKVIAWADDVTLFQGEATATAGAESGDGGFIEISGKGNLGFDGTVDASAANGAAGTVLFDPIDVTVELAGLTILPANPLTFLDSTGQLLSISPIAITNVTDSGSAVIIQADRDITINDAIATSASGSGGDLTLQAGQSILVNADIFTDNGTLKLYANAVNSVTAAPGPDFTDRGSGTAQISQQSGTTIDAGTGNVEMWMDFGVNGTAGNIDITDVKANHVMIKHNGFDDGGSILQSAGGTITASSVFIDHDGPINGTVGSLDPALNLVTDNLGAHIHAETSIGNGIYINAQPLNSTIVTVGNTCYGNGDAGQGCDTFGSHFVGGLETINGGGSINLGVTGDLLVVEPIIVDDFNGTGNPGDISLNVSGVIIVNSDIINYITAGALPAGNIDFTSSSAVSLFKSGIPGINGGPTLGINGGTVTVTLDDGIAAPGPGALLLNSGTFLEGEGVVDGDVISQGAVIDIGDSLGNVGALTITGSLSLDIDSIVVFDIIGSSVPGTDYDQLIVNGADGVLAGGSLVALWDTQTPPGPATYTLINTANGVLGVFDNVLGPVGTTFTSGVVLNDFQLNITAVSNIVFWDNAAGGDWAVGSNWLGGSVPGPTDFVDINVDGPITVTVSSAVPDILGISTQNELSIESLGQLTVTNTEPSLIGDLLTIDSSGGLNFDGEVFLAGQLSWKNGTLGGNGVMTIASIGVLELNSPDASVGIQLANGGTISKIDTGTTTLAGSIANRGSIFVDNGTLVYVGALNEGIIDVAAGATLSTADTDLTNVFGASIGGSGTIDVGTATLTNDGALDPGGADTLGILTIQGNLTLGGSASLQIEVDNTGLVPGIDYDQLLISGAAATGSLDGAVFVTLLNGDPVAGTYTLVDTVNGATLANSFGFPSLPPVFTALVTDTASVQTSVGNSVFWDDGAATGNWFDVLNWSTDALPQIIDDVTIAGSATTITIAGAAVANTLSLASGYTLNIDSGGLDLASDSIVAGDINLNGGTLDSAGNLQIDGNLAVAGGILTGDGDITTNGGFNWTGGSIAGIGLLTTTATTTLNSAGTLGIGRDWNITATLNHTNGVLQIQNGAVIANLIAYNANGGAQISSNGGPGIESFFNIGQFNVNADFLMQPQLFDNLGTINVSSGFVLSLAATGGGVAGTQSGTWNFNDATIRLLGNNWVAVSGFAIASLPGAALELLGGDLTNSSGGLLTLPADVAVSLNSTGSVIQGNDDIQIDGAFNWSAGALAGTGLLTTTGTSTVNSAGTLGMTRNWSNSGTINHTGGTLQIQSGATLTNNAIYNANGGTQVSANGGGGVETFVNTSQLNINSNFLVQPEQFDNSGTITVASGFTLSLGVAGSAVAGSQTGTWDFADATISLVSNEWVLGSGFNIASLPGATLNLVGGDLTNGSGALVTLPVNLTVNLNNNGSLLQGADDIQIDGAFNWSAGALAGTGLLTTTGTSTVNSAGTLGTTRDWSNNGTINHTGGLLQIQNGATLTNNAIYNANGGTQVSANGGAGVEYFLNAAAGQLNVNADFQVQPEQFDNAGTITVASATTLSLGVSGSPVAGSQTGTWDFTNGTIRLAGNNWVLGAGFNIASLAGAALNLDGGNLTNSAGGLVTLPANLTVSLNNNGSAIQGAGDIQIDGAFNWSAGTLGGAGLLTTTGTSTVSSGGTLGMTRNWTNGGTINHTAGILQIRNGATLTNNAIYNANGGTQVSANGGTGVEYFLNAAAGQLNVNADFQVQPEQFDNAGTITVASATTLSLGVTGTPVAGSQTGTWDFNDGTIRLASNNWVLGTGFNIASLVGAALNLDGGNLTNSTGGLVTLPANVTVSLNNNGSAIQGVDDIQIDGAFNWSAGTLAGAGLLTTTGTSTVSSGGTLGTTRNWTNSGTIDHTGGILQIRNGATLTNDSIYNAAGGTAINTNGGVGVELFDNSAGAVFNVSSNIAIQPEQFIQDGTLSLNGGDVTITQLNNAGTLVGSGTITGNVSTTGIVRPGGQNTVGALSVTGNYTQTAGVLEIEIQSTGVAGVAYDLLAVGGEANTLGTLTLLAVGGYVPSDNDSFSPITYTSFFGNQFGIINPIGTEIVTPNYVAASLDLLLGTAGGIFFDNDSGDFSWNTAINWSGDAFPTSGDDVTISGFDVSIIGLADANTLSLAGSDTLTVNIGGTLTLAGNSTLAGNLAINGGTLNLSADLVLNGNLDWTTGTVAGTGSNTLTNSVSSVSTLDSVFVDQINWVNNGTMTWRPAGPTSDFALSNASFTNAGTFNIETADLDSNILEFTASTFTNASSGVINSQPLAGAVRINMPITNNGDLNVVNSDLFLDGSSLNTGSIDIASGARISVSNGVVLALNAGTALSGLGTLELDGGATLDVNAPVLVPAGFILLAIGPGTSLNVNAQLDVNGDLILDTVDLSLAADLVINGSADLLQSFLSTSNGSRLIVNAGGTLNLDGGATGTFLNADVINDGFTAWAGGSLNSEQTFFNNSVFAIQNLAAVGYGGEVGVFNNSGSVFVTNSTQVDIFISYVDAGGNLDIGNASSFGLGGVDLVLNSGTLGGDGSFEGNVINNGGTVNPGGSGATGILTINGDFTNTAGGFVEIDVNDDTGSPQAGANYGQLAVTGQADLNGTLVIQGVDGFTFATNGANFADVITYTSITANRFSTINTIGSEIITPTYTGDLATAGGLSFLMSFTGLFEWTGAGGDGFWNTATNWNFGVPNIGNDVSIGGSFDVTIAAAAGANTLSLGSGASLTLTGSTLAIANDSTLDGGVTLAGGTLDLGGSTLTLNGGLNWTNTSTISNGTLNVPATATIDISGGALNLLSAVTANVSGNTNYRGGSLGLQNGAVFNNGGVFDFAGTLGIAGDGPPAAFNNLDGALVIKSAGALSGLTAVTTTNQGSVDVQTGTLDLNLVTWTLGPGDTFSGSGNYNGSVINNGGIVRPGGAGAIGVLSMSGNYTQNGGRLEIEVNGGGTTAGVDFDQLAIGASASWTNTTAALDISYLGGYIPAVGHTHTVVTCGGGCAGGTEDMGPITDPDGVTYLFNNAGTSYLATIDSVVFAWDGGGDGVDWFDPDNWLFNVTPDATIDAVISAGNNVNIGIDPLGVGAAANSLTLGGSLNIVSDGSLLIRDSAIDLLVNPGGALTVNVGLGGLTNNGDAAINGSLALLNGNLNLAGNTVVNGSYSQSGGNAGFTGALTVNGSYSQSGGSALFNGGTSVPGSFSLGGTGVANFFTDVVAGGSFAQTGGTATFNVSTNALFSGSFAQSGGSSIFNGVADIPGTLNLGGGIVVIDGSVTLSNLNNNWSGGTIAGSGGLVLGSAPGDTTLAVTGPAVKTLDGITLDMNQNDINMSGNGSLLLSSNAVIINDGNTFNHSGNGSIAGIGTFDNRGGTLNKGAGVATIAVDLVNDASSTINVAGGTLVVDDPGAGDSATYNVDSTGVLVFAQDRQLDGALNLNGTVIAGPLSATPVTTTTLTLPASLVNNGSILLNDANLDLSSLSNSTLVMNSASLLGGRGTVQGNIDNVAGVLVAGGNNTLGSLAVTGGYRQGPTAAVVVSVLNDGVDIVSSVLTVDGVSQLNGGTLLIGYLDESLGATTSDFIPIQFRGGVSGQFAQSIDAGGIDLVVEYALDALKVLGAELAIPDSIINDLTRFLNDSDAVRKLFASNKSEAEAIIQELIEAAEESGSLVCN